jgi:hypothetical protein
MEASAPGTSASPCPTWTARLGSTATWVGWRLVHRQVQHNEYTARLVGYPGADIEVAQLVLPGQRRGISTHDMELVHYRYRSAATTEEMA